VLLTHLWDFARSKKILDDLAFAPKAIRWIIPLDDRGQLVGGGLIETGEKGRGKEMSAPRTSLDKSAGGIAEFLADGITAVFGLDAEPDKKATQKQREAKDSSNAKKHQHFWSQIDQALQATGHAALESLRVFHGNVQQVASFLRYGKKLGSVDPGEKSRWWVKTGSGGEVAMGPDQFSFQVGGLLLITDETTVRPHWRDVHAREVATKEADSALGLCLVTGREGVPIARTHLPKIKGVRGTSSFGAAIVSFDKPAFSSYGFDQSLNAPVSVEAVAAYTNGLNALLKRDEHSLFFGETALCFWAKTSSTATVAELLRQPDSKVVAEFMKTPWAGLDRQAARLDPFFSVTLRGNAGRIVVRHWMQSTMESARDNLARWFSDLEIAEPWRTSTPGSKRKRKAGSAETSLSGDNDKEKLPPLALFRLACATVRDAKELRPEVLDQLYRAALEGTAPSVELVAPILRRLCMDLQKFGSKTLSNVSRFALLRLVLNRNRKDGDPMIEPRAFETDDPAYNCGRLLAVLAEAQAKAHDYRLEGAGVAERYFGTASVSPSSVFPLLMRLNRHHLDKIKKSERYGGHERFIEDAIQLILSRFRPAQDDRPPEFPRNLDLQAQGRFALGFYQQKAESDARKAQAAKAREAKPQHG
jgi:CRISPR-associated protein Csd1